MSVLADVFFPGNVTFVWNDDEGTLQLKSDKPLKLAAQLLGIDDAMLLGVLRSAAQAPTLDDEEPLPFTKAAEDMRDLISQTVYAKLFAWLVSGGAAFVAVVVGGGGGATY